jgi:hypothetical protein
MLVVAGGNAVVGTLAGRLGTGLEGDVEVLGPEIDRARLPAAGRSARKESSASAATA